MLYTSFNDRRKKKEDKIDGRSVGPTSLENNLEYRMERYITLSYVDTLRYFTLTPELKVL